MGFQPGNKGGPGRRKGSKNKKNERLRQAIAKFLLGNFESMQKEFDYNMSAAARARFYCELLPYALTKLQPDMEFDKLSDKDLESIVEMLKHKVVEASKSDNPLKLAQ